MHDTMLSPGITGVIQHNLIIIGTRATYIKPGPPLTNGAVNLFRASAKVRIWG